MKCPVCGGAELIHEIRDMPYTYKGESTIIPCVPGDCCPACSEVTLDLEASTRVGDAMLLFNKQVDAACVDPGYIANVRRKLALNHRDAAEVFGGDIDAFYRYENGKSTPPLAVVKLLKVLDRHPDLLDEVRAA